MPKTAGALAAALLAFAAVAPAAAQMKSAPKVSIKVVLDNAYVHVYQVYYVPGAVNPVRKRTNSVIQILAGPQKFKETYADGHTDIVMHNTGDVYWSPAATKGLTNVGSNPVRTLVTNLKQ